ncbi:MAG: hypothetical protein IKN81_10415 [Oscillospiraceae bacterium]|nr:hypothetical protein [Oscillospiraceae bacterium]
MAVKVRLNSASEIRRTLQRITNAMLAGELETVRANSAITACNAALNAIGKGEQDKKLAEMEMLLREIDRRQKGT